MQDKSGRQYDFCAVIYIGVGYIDRDHKCFSGRFIEELQGKHVYMLFPVNMSLLKAMQYEWLEVEEDVLRSTTDGGGIDAAYLTAAREHPLRLVRMPDAVTQTPVQRRP